MAQFNGEFQFVDGDADACFTAAKKYRDSFEDVKSTLTKCKEVLEAMTSPAESVGVLHETTLAEVDKLINTFCVEFPNDYDAVVSFLKKRQEKLEELHGGK